MHQALLVPEVLLEIFTYISRDDITSATQTRSTQESLAALATTCKVFHEPAMDLLWAEIDQLEPLLGCVTRLHPLIYRSGIRWDLLCAQLEGIKPLSAHEARQFLRHSARIRMLSIISDYPSHILSIILAESCVLPKLRSLTLYTKYLDLFLPHTLHRCHLLTVNEGLQPIGTRCAALENLYIYPPDSSADNSTADELSLLSDRIRQCTQLVTLSCPMPNWAAWMHLSYLPNLLGVEIDQGCSDHPSLLLEQDLVNFSPFLNITTLSFQLYSATYMIAVMQHSQFPSLKQFELQVKVLSSGEPEQLFRTLSHCKACQTLEKISVSLLGDVFEDSDISLTIIPHLLCFTQLRILRLIFFNASIYLDNDILLEALSTWSHICTLEIKDACFHPSPVSLRGLLTAIHLRPQLHTLRIAIDTAAIDIDPDAEPIQHPSLHILDLGTSELRIENAETLARIITAWLPCVGQVIDVDGIWSETNMHLTSLIATARCVARAS